MTRLWTKLSIAVLLSLLSTVVLAQEQTCPEIVQAALDATDEQCSSTGRNQACYGNVNLEAAPQPNVEDFSFSAPGDMVAVSAIESLTLASRVADEGEWGVALMQLQVNIPETTPGQNVTFLLFGDVEIENRVETNVDPVTFDVVAQGDMNVYSGPSVDGPIEAEMFEGDLMAADGRIADSMWLHVSESGVNGWVLAEDIAADGDVETLNVISPAGLPFTPMQAFYFKSGIGDAPCAEAPDSGILVQTPEGVTQVEFTVNAIHIVLGSTVYLQAQPGGEMTTSVVEGEATVAAGGASVVVPEGSRVRVPLDDNGRAAGAPSEPEPYDGAEMAVLPIRILPRAITIAAPISAEGTAEPPSSGSILTAGEWTWTPGTPSAEGCPAGTAEVVVANFTVPGPFQFPGGEFSWEVFFDAAVGQATPPGSVFSNPEPNTYVWEIPPGATWHFEARVIDSEHIEVQFQSAAEGCSMVIPFEMTRTGD
jgi:hypothetical protein